LPAAFDGTVYCAMSNLHRGSFPGETWPEAHVVQSRACRPNTAARIDDVACSREWHPEDNANAKPPTSPRFLALNQRQHLDGGREADPQFTSDQWHVGVAQVPAGWLVRDRVIHSVVALQST
jgi:hypothetical protein